jgi:type VI protein secretion system component VasK
MATLADLLADSTITVGCQRSTTMAAFPPEPGDDYTMLLAEIGQGELLWTTITIFFLFLYIWVFIAIFSDLIRDHEMSGVAKAVWIFALVVFTWIAVLVYVIVRGKGMSERALKAQADAQKQFDDYVRQTAGTATGSADELAKLADLKASGAISDDEFQKMKAKIVG